MVGTIKVIPFFAKEESLLAWESELARHEAALSVRGFREKQAVLIQTRLSGTKDRVLDKTGTVTGGRPEVVSVEDHVLRLAAGLERASIHPVARAILHAASERGIALPEAVGLTEVPGVGVSGVIDGRALAIRTAGPGRVQVVEAEDPRAPAAVVVGEIVLADAVRSDSRRSVAALRALGVDVRARPRGLLSLVRRLDDADFLFRFTSSYFGAHFPCEALHEALGPEVVPWQPGVQAAVHGYLRERRMPALPPATG